MACYRKAGLTIEPFSTDFYGIADKPFIPTVFIPSIQGFIIWEKLLKEWTGFRRVQNCRIYLVNSFTN
jgi:hypothetical protein